MEEFVLIAYSFDLPVSEVKEIIKHYDSRHDIAFAPTEMPIDKINSGYEDTLKEIAEKRKIPLKTVAKIVLAHRFGLHSNDE